MAAHLRLMEKLKERISTHIGMFHEAQVGRKIGRVIPQYLIDGTQALINAGYGQLYICRQLHIGRQTYFRILTLIRPSVQRRRRKCK